MSKKKATMTLKDFHGGSIPSDLPLPSAPGVTMRPADRGGFDRQAPWGNSVGRSDHRLRPASAGSARNLDDKSPFLSPSAQIGRNFDEDERKPLDGVSGPRRTISDVNIHAQESGLIGPKTDNVCGIRTGSMTASVQVSQVSSDLMAIPYGGRRIEVPNGGLSVQNITGSASTRLNYSNVADNAGKTVAGSNPNAWGLRKETIAGKEPIFVAWSAPDAETKLAHASALEKVSSGRWNSKEHVPHQKDIQVLGNPETGAEFLCKGNSIYWKDSNYQINVAKSPDCHDIALAMHAEKSLIVDDVIHSGVKEVLPYEGLRLTTQMESHERNPALYSSGLRSLHASGKLGGSEFHSSLPSEPSERPKLKLLPRSKPLEHLEPRFEYKQGLQPPSSVQVGDDDGVNATKCSVQHETTESMILNRTLEPSKLNLKPQSLHLEPLDGKNDIKRGTVFGGARPREVILMERGSDNAAISSHVQSPSRVKQVVPMANTSFHANPHFGEKAENVKRTDRRDHPSSGERMDSQMWNRRNEIRKNNKDTEKHRNQQLQDRPPSPETWRKPVEQPRPTSPPLRYGKAASAVELAQTFSRSVSDQALSDRFSGSKGIQRPGQIPFSRLTGPTPRPQINGY
ncbi:hypothetical protein F511_21505 [Dorcoceras hygrometricum]|uniref:Uncharacterized protein n=1 Tax=Dorcoceras hygrometricum TaxID=472368 RepID=A0A2Z7D7M9_9LAMI|nr:hypothetical protein F511_21505 [Dorcoceras hygrometricum]